jgi:transcriptional regulator with XRE-family HTH domain
MGIGHTIRDMRHANRWTQDEFAEKCDITQAYLSKIENDYCTISMSCLKKMAKALDVPASLIISKSLDSENNDTDTSDGNRDEILDSILKKFNELGSLISELSKNISLNKQ